MANDETFEVTLQLHGQNANAYLFSDDGEDDHAKWVGKSLVSEMTKKTGNVYEVTLPVWLATKNGWV